MANYVYIACSLDGCIAKPDGDLEWLTGIPNEHNDDYGFSRFMAGIDAVVLGRNTFEAVLGFDEWPYGKPVFVLSRTMQSLPGRLAGKAELLSGRPEEICEALNRRGFGNLYVDGGRTIQAFLEADLVDEMIVTTVSKIIGGGIPLFGSIGMERDFRVVRSEVLNDFMVKTYMVRDRS